MCAWYKTLDTTRVLRAFGSVLESGQPEDGQIRALLNLMLGKSC